MIFSMRARVMSLDAVPASGGMLTLSHVAMTIFFPAEVEVLSRKFERRMRPVPDSPGCRFPK